MNKFFKWQAPMLSLLLLAACTKIDTTQLGGNLIPAVDNVHTFDTILQVVTNNIIPDDSTRLNAADQHAVGAISDPNFGSSAATLFFELKPESYKWQFAPADSLVGLGLDSAVLSLPFAGYYGDSLTPVNYRLYQVDRKMQYDTILQPNYTLQPDLLVNTGKLWGSTTMVPNKFKDSVEVVTNKVSAKVNNQLRIRLDQTLAQQLFNQDTSGAYRSDSAFKEYLPGFALQTTGGTNSLTYFKMPGAKITFFFRRKNNGIDTTSASFTFSAICGHANKFDRNRSGAEINSYLANDPVNGKSQIYLQSTPGTMASVKIPGLAALSNRIIHRAELRVTQLGVPSGAAAEIVAPNALYLDAKDAEGNYRGIPYDLAPLSPYYCHPGAIDFSTFGGIIKNEAVNNELVAVYRFNISRYIQSVITRNEAAYELRLSAPFYTYYKLCQSANTNYPSQVFPFTYNGSVILPVGAGQVRVAGGNHANANLRMQLRIIYSKI